MTDQREPPDVFDASSFPTTVGELLLIFLDQSNDFEQREAALNDTRISSEEVIDFIGTLDPGRVSIALAFTTRPQVLTWAAVGGSEEQRAIVAYNPATPESVTDMLVNDVPYVRQQLPFRPVGARTWSQLLLDTAPEVREAVEMAFSMHEQLGCPEEERAAARAGQRCLWSQS